ncbi:MAG: hypothetical protein LW768_18225 [Rubrivivax sp.]|nr:hypothetical protein [Rubrivivax sp.]
MPQQPAFRPSLFATRLRRGAVAAAVATVLAGCGGETPRSASPQAPNSGTPSPTALTGTVAVGAPISDGRVRVLDSAGAVVASDIAVAADGTYTIPALAGTPPFRIEACGNVGANWQCIYSVAQGPGTANVTPLTTATVLLATGQTPEQVMVGNAAALGSAALDAAQQQLRTGLAPVLASSNVAANLDFISGSLTAGARTGYDRVLDSVGVNTGVDGQPFVQITPRLGDGNLFLQQGNSNGAVQVSSGAANLSLSGLEDLFRTMSAAMTSAQACRDSATGLFRSMASTARMSMGSDRAEGATQVAEALCSMLEQDRMYPVRLLSPVLGRCDLDGAAPVCRVGFVVGDGQGGAQNVGGRIGVTQENGQWKFLGDLDSIGLYAGATVQRDRRIDGDTPVDRYMRALAFDIAAVPGLQCAAVSQRNEQQQVVPVAYFKRFAGDGVERLSLWTLPNQGNQRSLDPANGTLRSSDDTWVALPEGEAGDEVVRNFLRGGRVVTVQLFADEACTSAFSVDGRSSFKLEIEGVPPVWASLPGLAWPELTAAGREALRGITLAGNASATLDLSWTQPRGPMGFSEATFCGDRATCGSGGNGRIAEATLRPGATTVRLSLQTGGLALPAGSARMLALFGRNGDGLQIQSNHLSCAGRPSGQSCDP